MTTDIEKIKHLHASEQHQVFFHDEVGLLLERIGKLEEALKTIQVCLGAAGQYNNVCAEIRKLLRKHQ